MIVVWFESHALTLDNEAKRASGWNDVDLSQAGTEQAVALLERSRSRGLDVVFCSDLQRAVKTAIPTANALHLPVYIDARLRECDYGDIAGQPSSILEQERLNRIATPFPGGESYNQTMERMASFYAELKQNFDGKTVLIIGHRATQYGIEVLGQGKTLANCMAQSSDYWVGADKPGMRYEIS